VVGIVLGITFVVLWTVAGLGGMLLVAALVGLTNDEYESGTVAGFAALGSALTVSGFATNTWLFAMARKRERTRAKCKRCGAAWSV
jgi:hypothetical protein